MSIKKKIAALLVAAMFVVPCVGLTACGNDDANTGNPPASNVGDVDNNGDDNTGGDNNGDDNTGGGNSGDEYDGLKSDKISSAEEWATAFDFSEVNNVTITVHAILDNETDVFAFDGDKHYEAMIENETSRVYERYYEYKEDEIFDERYQSGTEYRYVYYEEISEWSVTRSELFERATAEIYISECIDEITTDYDEESGEMIGYMHERFSDFTYDESVYAYVAHFDELEYQQIRNMNISVKFKNGKIAECEIAYEMDMNGDGEFEEDEIGKAKVVITELGTTVVTLPEVA